MTTREEFLATIRATPRGEDPGLPAAVEHLDAPTELRPGEDPVVRFLHELDDVTAMHERVDAADLGRTVASILGDVDGVALADDLGDLQPLLAAMIPTAVLYRDIAADRAAVEALTAVVTGCVVAVAATGSIVTGAATAGRVVGVIAPLHVCVVRRSQLVDGLVACFADSRLGSAGSMLALQSGPSRSADIEKQLILGVHGPGRVHVVFVDDA